MRIGAKRKWFHLKFGNSGYLLPIKVGVTTGFIQMEWNRLQSASKNIAKKIDDRKIRPTKKENIQNEQQRHWQRRFDNAQWSDNAQCTMLQYDKLETQTKTTQCGSSGKWINFEMLTQLISNSDYLEWKLTMEDTISLIHLVYQLEIDY